MNYKNTIIVVLLVAVIVPVGAYILFNILQGKDFLGRDENNKVIAKTIKENIYKKDLNNELASYPPELVTVNTEKEIIEKLKRDSIILQAGADEGLITLDNTQFNSSDKSYEKRLEAIKKVTEEKSKQSGYIKGEIVTIWFNNTQPASIGLVKGKQLALSKITAIYNEVKDKKITMKEAGDRIRNDAGLLELDKAYKVNAYVEFSNSISQEIVFDETFNLKLKSIPLGALTDVHLASGVLKKGERPVEMAYMFGTVTERASGESFDQWVDKYESKYEAKP